MGNPDRINLARIFHTDRNKETAKADGVPPAAQETAGETAFSPRKTSSLGAASTLAFQSPQAISVKYSG